MVVIVELAAEFQIQLAAELGDPVTDMLRLSLQILVVIKCDSCHIAFASFQKTTFYFTPFPGK